MEHVPGRSINLAMSVRLEWLICVRKDSVNFQTKYSYFRSLQYLAHTNFAARETPAGQNLQIFWNWSPKNITYQLKGVAFQKLQKVLNHSTQLYSVVVDIFGKCLLKLSSGLNSRMEWFLREKNCDTFYILPNSCRTPIPKLHVFLLPFHFVAGLQKLELLP